MKKFYANGDVYDRLPVIERQALRDRVNMVILLLAGLGVGCILVVTSGGF